MTHLVVVASWPRPLGGIYVTMLCSLHLIIKCKEEDMHCLWKEERPRDASIGCSDVLCGWSYIWGGMSCLVMGDEAKYILQPLLGHIWNIFITQHPWQCVAYINTMKWALRDTDRGRHWLMAPAAAIYLHHSSNSPGSGVEERMNKCRGLPDEYGVGGHWETIILFHAIANSWVGNTYMTIY